MSPIFLYNNNIFISMRKKIIENDFDWVDDIPSLELGHNFDDMNIGDEDISFGKVDDDAIINILPNEIVFNFELDHFLKVMDQEHSWALRDLLLFGELNSEVDWYTYDGSNEEDYLSYRIHTELLKKFEDLINDPRVKRLVKNNLETIDNRWAYGILTKLYDRFGRFSVESFEDRFGGLKYVSDLIYKGIDDWASFEDRSLSDMAEDLTIYRDNYVTEEYRSLLTQYGVTVEGDKDYVYGDQIKITIPTPFMGEHLNLSNMLDRLPFVGESWDERWYGLWDTPNVDINPYFENLLNKLEESINRL